MVTNLPSCYYHVTADVPDKLSDTECFQSVYQQWRDSQLKTYTEPNIAGAIVGSIVASTIVLLIILLWDRKVNSTKLEYTADGFQRF
jgi:uncharacterized protein (DUF2062 family)